VITLVAKLVFLSGKLALSYNMSNSLCNNTNNCNIYNNDRYLTLMKTNLGDIFEFDKLVSDMDQISVSQA